MIPTTLICLVYRMNCSDLEGMCILVWTLAPFFADMKCEYVTLTLLQEESQQLMNT